MSVMVVGTQHLAAPAASVAKSDVVQATSFHPDRWNSGTTCMQD